MGALAGVVYTSRPGWSYKSPQTLTVQLGKRPGIPENPRLLYDHNGYVKTSERRAMGLDGTVRCRCFEEGRLRPGPVPLEDVYVDEEGYLASRTLDEARERLTRRQFDARYADLERAFDDWLHSCCEHEDAELCAEHVANWSGCAEFRELVDRAGGEKNYPLLSALLPDGNDGTHLAEKAAAALAELDRFAEWVAANAPQVIREGRYGTAERPRRLLEASRASGNPIRWC